MSTQTRASELIAAIKSEWGMTNQKLADMLGRSEKMVRKIQRGDVPAVKYETALREIYDNGAPEHQPPRPRTKAGKLVKVRGKAGEKAVLPPDPPGKYRELPRRGKAVVSRQAVGKGSYRSTYAAPKTKRAKGRGVVNNQILSDLRSEARGQARGRKRVKFTAVTSSGRVIPVGAKGGYSVSDALKAVNKSGAALDWMGKQVAGRYAETSGGRVNIVGWEMTTYYAGGDEPQHDSNTGSI